MFNKRGERDFYLMKNKKGQVTIFIIIAILLLVSISLILILKPTLFNPQIPSSIQPLYNSFLSCLEDDVFVGIDLLETQAGYIETPDYEMGSPNIPFSSQLNFVGNYIPYWYYVSGSNIPKEQIPSKENMESEMKEFLQERIRKCNLETYYEEGFEITQNDADIDVQINNNFVVVDMFMDLEIKKGEDVALIKNHKVSIPSNLGSLYNSARIIYEKQKKEMFLEEYGIDVLRLYAPVDGVELTCGPKIWNSYDVFSSLKEAIEVNTLFLNTKKSLTQDEKYFFVDASIPNNVRFITSQDWPMSFEVLPSEGNMLIAEPIGNQQGLGIAGLCFVPYHFVYDFNYPILVQVYEGEEIFQFPIAVMIKKNNPRIALNSSSPKDVELEICPYKNTLTNLRIIDSDSNLVDAEISYDCFGESCYIGKTNFGVLEEEFPQCANGFINVKADGFAKTKYQYSTITEGSAEIVMNKLYTPEINLKLNRASYNEEALIYFNSEDNSQIVSYPEQNKVNLSEGDYKISVYIYKNSSIQLEETSHEECVDVPNSGILGVFGATQESCFEMKTPAQIISNALTAGGNADTSFSEDELKNSNIITINADNFGTPSSLDELQNNYLLFEVSQLEVNLN